MVADRIVLVSLVLALVLLAVFLIAIILRWMFEDARLRGRRPWLPAALFISPPLVAVLMLALLRPAGRLFIVVAVLGLAFLGVVAWFIIRPSLLPSGGEGVAKATAALRRRLAWLCGSALLVAATAPFAVSFLVVGAARRSPLWNSSGHHLLPMPRAIASLFKGFVHDPQMDLGLPFEDMEFPAVDGKTLRGWFVPSRMAASVAVVTVHGYGWDRREWLQQLSMFHDLGYPVLLFDCRNHGGSDGDGTGVTLGVQESSDVSSAVQFLKGPRGFLRVVVAGVSQGAASAILAAGHDHKIDGVIAVSPFGSFADLIDAAGLIYRLPKWLCRLTVNMATWRLNASSVGTPLEAIAHISPRPILLIHGTSDHTIPYSASQALFNHAGQPKSLWLARGADHGVVVCWKYPDECRQRVEGYLQGYFPLAPTR
jgi:alpha-beta hydrolase superfamily lysophospholipase